MLSLFGPYFIIINANQVLNHIDFGHNTRKFNPLLGCISVLLNSRASHRIIKVDVFQTFNPLSGGLNNKQP